MSDLQAYITMLGWREQIEAATADRPLSEYAGPVTVGALRRALAEIDILRAEIATLRAQLAEAQQQRDDALTELADTRRFWQAVNGELAEAGAMAAEEATMNEVDQRATKWSLSGRLRHAAVGACDPECEGRCRVCPADAMREAADTLDLFAEAFKDEPWRSRHPSRRSRP